MGIFTLLLCVSLLFPELSLSYTNGEDYIDLGEDNIEFDDEYIEDDEDVELGESVAVEGILSTEPPTSEDIGIQCIACVQYQLKVTTVSGPTKVTKKFVRYLTGSWAKASSYTWSKSQTASATVSADVGVSAKEISAKLGVAKSVTTTYSIAISIPANSKKFSKLGFYSDYNKRYVKVQRYMDGKLLSTKYTNHYAPRKDTYLQVVYKK